MNEEVRTDETDKRRLEKPRIGISIGDFNGIGPEVILKTLSDERILRFCTPIIYANPEIISFYKKNLQIDFSYHLISDSGEGVREDKVNLINCFSEKIRIEPGKSDKTAGACAFSSIKAATKGLKTNIIDAVVTAPINKENIQTEEFRFPGHTEYFMNAFEAQDGLMLLISEGFRVGVVTGHIPVSKVSSMVSKEAVHGKIKLLTDSLRNDFNIRKPKIAVLGLNPHAGEGGLLGKEEEEYIAPAVLQHKKRGNLVYGPFPADGFFGRHSHSKFDAVLAMYHDQGLIPFKSFAFERGVNYTAGLSAVRTSPDHGTAFDIAGKNQADPTSMREALLLARDIVRNRTHLKSEKKPAQSSNRDRTKNNRQRNKHSKKEKTAHNKSESRSADRNYQKSTPKNTDVNSDK